jgi:hypothetical protein
MKPSSIRSIVLLSPLLYALPLSAQDQIVVDAGATVANVARRPIGINLNFLLDDDGNRGMPSRRLIVTTPPSFTPGT